MKNETSFLNGNCWDEQQPLKNSALLLELPAKTRQLLFQI